MAGRVMAGHGMVGPDLELARGEAEEQAGDAGGDHHLGVQADVPAADGAVGLGAARHGAAVVLEQAEGVALALKEVVREAQEGAEGPRCTRQSAHIA